MTVAFTSPQPSKSCTALDILGELCTSVFGVSADLCPLKVKLVKGDAVDSSNCASGPTAAFSGGRALANHVAKCPAGGCTYEYEVEGNCRT